MKQPSLEQFGRFFLVISLLIIGFLTIKHVFIFLYPLLIALGLTLLYHPMILFITNRLNLPKLPIIIFTVVLTFIIFLMIGLWFLSEIVQGIVFFIDFIPKHFTAFVIFIEEMYIEYILPIYESLLSGSKQHLIKKPLSQMLINVQNNFISLLENIVMKTLSFLTIFPYSFAICLFILIATILLTKDWQCIRYQFYSSIPQQINKKIRSTFSHFKFLLLNYFKAQLIIVTITAVIIFIGLVCLNIKHALTITFFTALVDFLPVIGTGFIFIPWIIYLFLYGNYSLTIGLSFLYLLIIIIRQTLEPKIISQHLGVQPLTALLCLFFGVKLWGIGGFIFAPFLLIFGQALVKAEVFSALWHFIKGSSID